MFALSRGILSFSRRCLLLDYLSEEFSAKLLEQEKVAVVSGHAFGADGYIRLSYATSDEVIQKGIDRLNTFANRLVEFVSQCEVAYCFLS